MMLKPSPKPFNHWWWVPRPHYLTPSQYPQIKSDLHPMATTTATTIATTTEQHQGWAQPSGSRLWHYYRVTGEFTEHETSLCGAWDSAGVNPEELYDKNHGCADHCQGCQRRRA